MAVLVWTAGTAGTWALTGNWTPAQLPTASDTVVFDGSGADISVVSGFVVTDLLVDDPMQLIAATGPLTVTGLADFQSGTLQIGAGGKVSLNDFNTRGTVIVGAGGMLELTGTYDGESVNRIFGNGGTVVREGTLLNTGQTLVTTGHGTFAPTARTNETIIGGTVVGSLAIGRILDNVTWLGTLRIDPVAPGLDPVANRYVIRDGLAVVPPGGVGPGTIDFGGVLGFEGDVTLDDVTLHMDLLSPIQNGILVQDTLVLGPNAALRSDSLPNTPFTIQSAGTPGIDPPGLFINHGLVQLQSQSVDGSALIRSLDVENHGTISVQAERRVPYTPAGGSPAEGPVRLYGNLTIEGGDLVNAADGVVQVVTTGSLITPAAMTIAADSFVNDGTVVVSYGVLNVNVDLAGTGTVVAEAKGMVALNGAVGTGQTVDLNGEGTVTLGIPFLFGGTITNLTSVSRLVLQSSATALSYTDHVLHLQLSGGQAFGITILGDLDFGDFVFQSGASTLTISTTLPAPCFAAGTLIRTARGDVAVERLQAGDDIVVLSGGGTRPVIWIGQRQVDCARHPAPAAVWPVRVACGAFGGGLPERDLYLSPDHAVFHDGALIPIRHLVNGSTIFQVPVDSVHYYHVELPMHDVILAEGLAVESYLDTDDRDCFANGGDVLRLFPTFGAGAGASLAWDARACAPLLVTGPRLDALRARLATRTRRAA